MLCSISAFAQKRITFKIEKLSTPENFLYLQSYDDIYKRLIMSETEVFSKEVEKQEKNPPFNIIAKSEAPDSLVSYRYHSFFQGMYQAYADHRPFVLSPDMIWLLISQGFARHINANQEAMRDYIVDFSGKQSLIVKTDKQLEDPTLSWNEIFPQFTEQIKKQVGNSLVETLTCNFSTTTPLEKIASEITIMESVKPYFEFIVIRIVCGIPEITLEGTPEDWEKVLSKAKSLKGYKLEWWISELEPLLEEFVKEFEIGGIFLFIAGNYDVIIIGAGHAGVEAALASARMGCNTLLTTLNMDNIAMMPCNPSVGGPAKGHLVREIDALGGEMGVNADKTCIQYRMLNTGKGPAVQALRAQADKKLYQNTMKHTCELQENLDVKQLLIDEILFEDNKVTGVVVETGEVYTCKAVVLASGTYLKGRIIIGENTYDGGPNGQRAAIKLSSCLLKAGVELMRFKTGTPARVDRRSLDFSKMIIQPGDDEVHNFSFMSDVKTREQVPCWLTYTNEQTHKIIRDNIERAPMANGIITGVGPRYCPSIETKIVRFPDKERHQLFIEPEGLDTEEMYVQGMSTSMPIDVQMEFLRTIPGLENVRIMRPGYAIEYDCINPLQLKPSLEFKKISGFFSAGQTNGTSGYEEAASQGLIAGINAALKIQGKEPLILKRSDGYIGVLIDDLVTKGTNEPYRVMTSRAEYRLLLRQDNADLRLTEKGRQVGLVSDERYARFVKRRDSIKNTIELLSEIRIHPNKETLAKMQEFELGSIHNTVTAADLLKRKEISYDDLKHIVELPEISEDVKKQVEITLVYEGYIKKQLEQVERMEKLEEKLLPEDINYDEVSSLRDEAREKLNAIRPISIGQASRISGVSPADISVLLVYLEQYRRQEENA